MTAVVEHPFGTIRSAPGWCFNTNRRLTRSLDSTKEGLAMKATPATCKPYTGRDSQFQAKAADAYFIHTGTTPATWEWITTTCETRCVNPDHLRFIAPRKIRYPNGLCIYCGRRAGTKDHLIPRGWSGETKRRWVAIVPWPGGSDYDARALQRSGIEDPWAAGLIISDDEANRIAREVCFTGAGDARRFYWNQWAS